MLKCFHVGDNKLKWSKATVCCWKYSDRINITCCFQSGAADSGLLLLAALLLAGAGEGAGEPDQDPQHGPQRVQHGSQPQRHHGVHVQQRLLPPGQVPRRAPQVWRPLVADHVLGPVHCGVQRRHGPVPEALRQQLGVLAVAATKHIRAGIKAMLYPTRERPEERPSMLQVLLPGVLENLPDVLDELVGVLERAVGDAAACARLGDGRQVGALVAVHRDAQQRHAAVRRLGRAEQPAVPDEQPRVVVACNILNWSNKVRSSKKKNARL